MNVKYSYAILSGGQSSRFGSDKTKAKFKGKTLYDHALDTAESVSDDILFISKDNDKYTPHRQGVRYIEDILNNQCPLSGIVTAMKYATHENIFIISADMPLITKQIVDIIITSYEQSDSDMAMPVVGGKLYTLSAVYKKEQYDDFLRSYNLNNYKIYDLVKSYNIRYIREEEFSSLGVDLKRFININRKEDMILAEEI